jgi:DNA gyrase/topoisomerase IV subunit B
MVKKAYGVDAIKTLEGVEAIRTHPGMYIGSVGPDGVRHITLEIISNAIDEYLNGYCTKCRIEVEKDNTIKITDNGRGVPFGKAADGSETLENIFTKLHTGAKFDSSGKTGYNTSGGMNGIGAKATNALSSKFIVKSMRDGKNAVMTFERGIRKDFKVTPMVGEPVTGTIITFRPDEEIFKEGIELDKEALRKQLKELSYLSPGLEFHLGFKGDWETIISEN